MQAAYTYDAWGKILSIYDADDYVDVYSISHVNPFRYRGYVYDQDTKLYYCQSRYYDPQLRRFINADESTVIDGSENFAQYNLFAYCFNNPVNMADYTGESPANIVGGIIGGVSGAALGYLLVDFIGLKGWKKWSLISAATVGGAVLGAFLGPYVAKLGNQLAASLGINTIAQQCIKISSSTLWERSSKHIFSQYHIKNGIMQLGNSQRDIFNKLYEVVSSNLADAVDGSNQIHTTINGIRTTIRFYVSNGEVQSMDAFIGWATRVIGKIIE